MRAVEDPLFPFEELSKIAEQESWRKEINRPTYHIHKWWAQRLGSVFRALTLGTFYPKGSDIVDLFYKPSRIGDRVVFDPFMGSGTTLGEVLKLGGRAFGQDINPVAYFLVKNALDLPRRDEILQTFRAIEADTSRKILELYSAKLPNGDVAQVLYYFWVKNVDCIHCQEPVDLFPSYVFAQHVYKKQHPQVQIICPSCSNVYAGTFGISASECPECKFTFNPLIGTVSLSQATCSNCNKTFRIVKAVQASDKPPRHRLYAKLVLSSNGQKSYLAANEEDRALYDRAARQLSQKPNAFPTDSITPGYNTNQILKYCYRSWHELFNDRQLLCLSILADRIRAIADQRLRELFCCLFSGTLEFNNMFASYKGEGTGAVRHMFSHHVLKPERTPIEANIWGTPRSSGSFSTLFKSRILRAIEYAENPFEIKPNGKKTKKIFYLSKLLTPSTENQRQCFGCGDSSKIGLKSGSVHAVITDPPFFDNVHYSELADFFFVWQRHVLGKSEFHLSVSTRASEEVQHADALVFENRLASVWTECRRVLKPDGLMVFTFHHSRSDGWGALLGSLHKGGFYVVAAHPIRSEMSTATPLSQAKDPIGLDMIFVCRKLEGAQISEPNHVCEEAEGAASSQLHRLLQSGFGVSPNDTRILVFSHAVRLLSRSHDPTNAIERIKAQLENVALEIGRPRPRFRAQSA